MRNDVTLSTIIYQFTTFMYKLIPLEQHCIVEVSDFFLPPIDLVSLPYTESNASYTEDILSNNTYKRFVADVTPGYRNLFRDRVNIIIEMMKQHKLYTNSKLYNDTNNALGVSVCRDSVGWKQDIHVDHPDVLMSGVVHITDCDTPTKFYKDMKSITPLYVAPNKAGSGAFWLNTDQGFHGVDPVTVERNHFFFLLLRLAK